MVVIRVTYNATTSRNNFQEFIARVTSPYVLAALQEVVETVSTRLFEIRNVFANLLQIFHNKPESASSMWITGT